MNSSVHFYFEKAVKWKSEIESLRTLILHCGLTEELKWGCPCYTFQQKNIVLIHVFKEYCALLFFKGALLQDEHQLLTQQTKNVQAARQLRFTSVEDVETKRVFITEYIYEAIEIEKAGLKVEMKKTSQFTMPEEFINELQNNNALQTAFQSLTEGRQRAYSLYFSAPKQSKTRLARIEKYKPLILNGKGLHD